MRSAKCEVWGGADPGFALLCAEDAESGGVCICLPSPFGLWRDKGERNQMCARRQ